jgi:hypothetical protein
VGGGGVPLKERDSVSRRGRGTPLARRILKEWPDEDSLVVSHGSKLGLLVEGGEVAVERVETEGEGTFTRDGGRRNEVGESLEERGVMLVKPMLKVADKTAVAS